MNLYKVNPDKKYYNFEGKMPLFQVDKTPADIPHQEPRNHPKVITDTTMRDGAQDPCFAIFPNEAKLRYFDLLHELDNSTGLIDSVEVFIYQKRDLWTLEKLLARGYEYPRVTTWTRAIPKDIRHLMKVSDGRITETGILASSSDHHIFDHLGCTSKEKAIAIYLEPILTAFENGIIPRIHLEDATRSDIEGWVIPFMRRVIDMTSNKVIFRVCDTLGVGIPDPYVSLPFGIPKLISRLSQAAGAELEFHGHNDFGNATSNSMAALRYGSKKVNATFAGLGERTGNASLEQVLANYIREYGDPGLKLEKLAEIADLFQKQVVPVPAKQPIIGRNIFTTQAGLHQSGVKQQSRAPGGLIYLPFDPELVGRRGETLNRVGSLSGMDGIISLLNDYKKSIELGGYKFTSYNRLVQYVYDLVQEAYDGQYDSSQDRYKDYRKTFFELDDLAEMIAVFRSTQLKK